MTASLLTEALRACAAGIYTHEAGVSLLIANRTFLSRDDSTSRFITRNPTAATAAVDWAAAIAALDTGETSRSGPARPSQRQPRRPGHRPPNGHANLKPDKT
jgi:hypothetical protein